MRAAAATDAEGEGDAGSSFAERGRDTPGALARRGDAAAGIGGGGQYQWIVTGKGTEMARKAKAESCESPDARGRALRLRMAGATCEEIAGEAGFHSAVEASMAVRMATRAMPVEETEDARRMMLARLDAMLAGVWNAATEGDTAAIHAVLKIEERREHLLDREEKRAKERDFQRRPLDPEQLKVLGFSA